MEKNKVMRFVFVITLLFVLSLENAFAQTDPVQAEVSFISSQYVYVKFNSTKGLESGDTLFIEKMQGLVPALIIGNCSSRSCACQKLGNENLAIGQKLGMKLKMAKDEKNEEKKDTQIISSKVNPSQIPEKLDSVDVLEDKSKTVRKERMQGRLSTSFNGDISEPINSRHSGIRISSSFNVYNLNKSKLSLFSYVTYRHRYGVQTANNDFINNCKVYSLSMSYDFNAATSLSFGRKINNNISSLGAADGLQIDHKWKSLQLGIVLGWRPDLSNYGLNFNLPQAGIYVANTIQRKNQYYQNSLGFIEQRVGSKVDRRFLYFQNNSQLSKKWSAFFSSEIDLYENVRDTVSITPKLTSIYANLRYRPSRKINFQLGYDNRQNVVYYESYKHQIDQLLDQATRQGLRFSVQYNVLKSISVNASSFLRFQSNQSEFSKNYLVNIYKASTPKMKWIISINGNYLETEYLKGIILGGRISKDLFKQKLNIELNYRRADYQYQFGELHSIQHIISPNISYYISRRSILLFNFESNISDYAYHRYYLTYNYRFGR